MTKMICSITDGEQYPEDSALTELELALKASRFDKIYSLLISGAAVNKQYRLNEMVLENTDCETSNPRLFELLCDGVDVVGMYNDGELTEKEGVFLRSAAAVYATKLVEL
jgi:hypothetical protein